MATDLLDTFPNVARETLLELARLQGIRTNPRADEEPGRIVHENRVGSGPWHLAEIPQWDFPYYGAVDTPPAWINLLHAYWTRYDSDFLETSFVDRLGRRTTVATTLLRVILWILGRLDAYGLGYVFARRATKHGMINQSWTDSFDAFFFEDGRLFDPDLPRVAIEVQSYVYDSLLAAAELVEQCPVGGFPSELPSQLRRRAAHLRARLIRDFWLEEEGTFGVAGLFVAPGDFRVARVVSSNAGHLLAGHLLAGTEYAWHRARLAERLLAPDMLAAAGVRTKSTRSARFRAGAYHNGSTWPFNTGVIADGLRRHGYEREADTLEDRILRGCIESGVFPEFFRGDTDDRIRMNSEILDIRESGGTVNRLEQPPQPIQGWTVTRVWRILWRRGHAPIPSWPSD